MCYFLYIASPLTLSEVRSMLPPGASADLASSTDQRILKSIHPDAQTVAHILVGRCSCDLVRARAAEPLEDERHLRERYRRLEVARPVVIAALERHRRSTGSRSPAEGWPRALANFVAEHARNAGPTLYYLGFSSEPPALASLDNLSHATVFEIRSSPEGWLKEGIPTLVTRGKPPYD
jgi:hypothetical protein